MLQRWLGAVLLGVSWAALADKTPEYGVALEGFDYPYPVRYFEFDSQQQSLRMAYLDVQPEDANGQTVVLLHGKNFCAATWESTLNALSEAGYRVIAPDQIGFCKSAKPAHYQFSFQQLAANTRALLDSLGIKEHLIMGHSMGGMLATRYALMYPERVSQLVLLNPIGLEDWLAKGVPYRDVQAWYESELRSNAEGMRRYQQATYYAGEWRPEFDRWVTMQAGMFAGPGRERVAWLSALTYDMILTQPVYYEFPRLKVPTLLLIGEQDNTAVGKASAPEAARRELGNYPALAREAAARIPDAELMLFPEWGHSPQVQAPAAFHRILIEQLAD